MHPFMSNEPLLKFTKTMRQHFNVLSLSSDWLVTSRWPSSNCKRCLELDQIKGPMVDGLLAWSVIDQKTLSTTLLNHSESQTLQKRNIRTAELLLEIIKPLLHHSCINPSKLLIHTSPFSPCAGFGSC